MYRSFGGTCCLYVQGDQI